MNDDAVNTTFAISLEGEAGIIVSTDQRLLAYGEGDAVTLTCSYEWVYGGADVKHCILKVE